MTVSTPYQNRLYDFKYIADRFSRLHERPERRPFFCHSLEFLLPFTALTAVTMQFRVTLVP